MSDTIQRSQFVQVDACQIALAAAGEPVSDFLATGFGFVNVQARYCPGHQRGRGNRNRAAGSFKAGRLDTAFRADTDVHFQFVTAQRVDAIRCMRRSLEFAEMARVA